MYVLLCGFTLVETSGCFYHGSDDENHREDFDSLVRTISIAPPSEHQGKLGEIDIRTFPLHTQKELEKLNVGEFTTPLQLGNSFIIFKRLAAETAQKND